MGGALDQIGGERLAALVTDIHAVGFANLHGIEARRLAAHGVNTG
jgi:hypothetical protein